MKSARRTSGATLSMGAAFLTACAGPLAGIDTSCELVPSEPRCSTPSLQSALLPDANPDDADYNRRFLALLAEQKIGEADRANGTGPFGRDINSITHRDFLAAYRGLEAAADRSLPRPSRGTGTGTFSAAWRLSRQTLFIDADALDAGPAGFQFSGLQAREIEIEIRQIAGGPATIAGRCDGEMAVGPGRRIVNPGETVYLSLAGIETSGDHSVLYPGPDLDRCDMVVRSKGKSRRLMLLREEIADPKLARLDSLYQRCPTPDLQKLSPLASVFYASRELSETCPMAIGKPKLLLDSRDAFNAKVEALAGSRLPDSFFDAADPEAPIDVSRAPKLELIYFSYLQYRADFSGRVMERLIRFHAARGTKVRITVAAVLEREKDRALLRALAADFPNVQLQEFAWDPATGAPTGEQISRFHKAHHVKMLATLAKDLRRSRAIIGGRNIHDGFLFHEPVDLSSHPDLHQYDATSGLSFDYYSNWSDLDIEVAEPEAVRLLVAHSGTLWHRDDRTGLVRLFSIAGKRTVQPPAGATARHFISVPYADRHALEDYYAELIDAAAETIEIVNPYLNLTQRLSDAFGRASDRGVEITLVTGLDFRGDFGGRFLTELNELFVEKYARRIAIRVLRTPEIVPHAKILMIDGHYVSVSSVNFNNRSFVHDSENGIAALDPAFYVRMKPVFDFYVARSRPIDPDVHVPLFYRLLFSTQHFREAF
jgi:phosphatidylserine/phosphatidylglycerophosphate/cardiolipin synthase-like enzyme